MTDGLSMLDEKRQRRSRNIPAPKNPPRRKPVSVAELPADQETETPAHQATEPVELPSQDNHPPQAVQGPITPVQETTPAQEPTVKLSLYLESRDDVYLEDIAHAGKTARPRVAISRSAIVRLALEQLAKTMTAAEIVEELRDRGLHHQGTGRKRR